MQNNMRTWCSNTNIEGKRRRYRKRTKISIEAGDQDLLTGSEEK
jgi:hypothetical protein